MELIAYFALVPIIIGGFKQRIALGSLLGLATFVVGIGTLLFWNMTFSGIAEGMSQIAGFVVCVASCLVVFYLDDDWKGFRKIP